MFAPFVQGFLLVGVIYWYTKGMMTIINDYYREEFKDYLDKDPKKELLLKGKQVDEATVKKNIDLSPRIEGLPDVLTPDGSIHCRDGIASRGVDSPTAEESVISSLNKVKKNSGDNLQQIEKCPPQGEQVVTSASLPEDACFGATTSSSSDSRQLLDSTECNLKFQSELSDGRRPNCEPILNPSAASKSNCEQIVNQQVSIIIDESCKLESTTITPPTLVASATKGTATIFRRDEEVNGIETGNYPGNVGCTRRTKSFSGQTILTSDDGSTKLKTIPAGISSTLQVDHLRLNACRRKSVNEMIQFWSKFDQRVQTD